MTRSANGDAHAIAYEVAVSSIEQNTDATRRLERRLRMRVQPTAPASLIWPGRDARHRGASPQAIFAGTARVVVILHAAGWNRAPATAEDRAGIRRRLAAGGAASVRLVTLDGSTPPAWLRGAASRALRDGDVEVCAEWIADAVAQAGGAVRRPTADAPATVSPEERLALDRDTFLASHRALSHLTREFERLTTEVAHRIEAVAPKDGEMKAEVQRAPGRCTVQLGPVALSLSWVRTRPDTVSTGRLMIIEWEGTLGGTGLMSDGRPRAVPIREDVLRVEATRAEDWQWRSDDGSAPGYDSRALAARCVDWLAKAYRTRGAGARGTRTVAERRA